MDNSMTCFKCGANVAAEDMTPSYSCPFCGQHLSFESEIRFLRDKVLRERTILGERIARISCDLDQAERDLHLERRERDEFMHWLQDQHNPSQREPGPSNDWLDAKWIVSDLKKVKNKFAKLCDDHDKLTNDIKDDCHDSDKIVVEAVSAMNAVLEDMSNAGTRIKSFLYKRRDGADLSKL
jgi:DNA repair exonuclease SbcCD ATPase subunit